MMHSPSSTIAALLLVCVGCTAQIIDPRFADAGPDALRDQRVELDANQDLSVQDAAEDLVADMMGDATFEDADAETDAQVDAMPGPISSFCDCSKNNPADNAGSFEMCATLLPNGLGTYYDPGPYPRAPERNRRPGVPEGTLTNGNFSGSSIFPNTSWQYWVYVPQQYDAQTPAALLVLTDGNTYQRTDGEYNATAVLDNLIDEGALPPTIAVFVSPGRRGDQSRRRFEYDTPSDDYVRFLSEELLPDVLSAYSVTDDPSLRAIGGRSSGGAAAFTACWERPDLFGLAYTTIGSFVRLSENAAGEFADRYPAAIENSPIKPIRVSLLSGKNDLDNEFGNWRDAHMAMTTALDCAGYAYVSGFGNSGHGDSFHPRTRFADDLRWLFKRP